MTQSKKKGDLILVPTPLGDSALDSIPEINREIISQSRHFIVESMKMGRRHILAMAPGKDLEVCEFDLMDKNTDPLTYQTFLDPALEGYDICLVSDAGSPSVADPGSPVVQMAHQKGIRVRPLSGPSSILQALMASGFNGQQFAFHGYLAPQKKALSKQLKELERAARAGITQIFMETPYRNQSLFTELLRLKVDTMLCLATNISLPGESIITREISSWKLDGPPDIHKQPTIFLLGY